MKNQFHQAFDWLAAHNFPPLTLIVLVLVIGAAILLLSIRPQSKKTKMKTKTLLSLALSAMAAFQAAAFTLIGIAVGTLLIAAGITAAYFLVTWAEKLTVPLPPALPVSELLYDSGFPHVPNAERYCLVDWSLTTTVDDRADWEKWVNGDPRSRIVAAEENIILPQIAFWLEAGEIKLRFGLCSYTYVEGELASQIYSEGPAIQSDTYGRIERSVDLVKWEPLTTLPVLEIESLFIDQFSPAAKCFYRMVRVTQ